MTSATSNLMKTRDFYLRKVKKSGRDGTGILIDHIEIKSQLLKGMSSLIVIKTCRKITLFFLKRRRTKSRETSGKKMPVTAEFAGNVIP